MAERTALVTGSGANVGRAIAHRLAGSDAVSRVIVNDLNGERAQQVADEINAAGHAKAEAIVADITQFDQVTEMFAAAGQVDILVNNAGVPTKYPEAKRFVDTEPDDWKAWIDINLMGVMYATRMALPGMIEGGWGRVVTIVSDAGRVGEPFLVAYSAAKGGSAALTRAVAREVGRHGITCNNVALGTMSNVTAHLDDEQIGRMLKNHYIVQRTGEFDDAAGAVAYLAGDEASWVSGQILAVNGGYSVTM
jgi:2-hydroxycyclohexanecarboxyl-CoA dehydrogenase